MLTTEPKSKQRCKIKSRCSKEELSFLATLNYRSVFGTYRFSFAPTSEDTTKSSSSPACPRVILFAVPTVVPFLYLTCPPSLPLQPQSPPRSMTYYDLLSCYTALTILLRILFPCYLNWSSCFAPMYLIPVHIEVLCVCSLKVSPKIFALLLNLYFAAVGELKSQVIVMKASQCR